MNGNELIDFLDLIKEMPLEISYDYILISPKVWERLSIEAARYESIAEYIGDMQ